MRAAVGTSRLAVVVAGGLVLGGLVAPGHATPPPGPTSCRASVLRAAVAGSTLLEPVVANRPGALCATQNKTVLEITSADTGGLLDLTLLKAKTEGPPPGPANGPHPASAEAGVAELHLHLGAIDARLPEVVEGVQSRVGFSCIGSTLTNPTFSGTSHVLRVSASGIGSLEVPQDLGIPQTITVPGVLKLVFNEQIATPTSITRRAIHLTVFDPTGSITSPVPIADIVVAEATLSFPADGSSTACPPPPPPPSPTPKVGWMTGGGKLDGGVTHSLQLPCTLDQDHPKPGLKVKAASGSFDLDTLTQVSCSLVAGNGDPEQPDAGFNTLTGKGLGSCNGHTGVDVSFTFTDGGEPNKGADKATIDIDRNNAFGCHLHVTGTVNGNQQAHRG